MMVKPVKSRYYFLIILILGIMVSACQKEETKDDPYAQVKKPATEEKDLDSTSIQGLHQKVFALKCANPGCHDGAFEPDFRTVQSTYSTLVYAPIVKPDFDTDRNIQYRVQPGDTGRSWLWERLTTNDTLVLGRMPSNGSKLPKQDLQNIKQWIQKGALDMYGNALQSPNKAPDNFWFTAYTGPDTALKELNQRVDGWGSPLILPENQEISLWTTFKDDSSLTRFFKDNAFYLSYDREDFSKATKVTAKFYDGWTGFWRVFINTATLPKNRIIYLRYTTRDPLSKHLTTYPHPEGYYWQKNNFSVIVK